MNEIKIYFFEEDWGTRVFEIYLTSLEGIFPQEDGNGFLIKGTVSETEFNDDKPDESVITLKPI